MAISSGQAQNEEFMTQMRDNVGRLKLDTFRLKIGRIDPLQGGIAVATATFDGANPRHVSSPETWLPAFAGGGLYHLLPVTADREEARLCQHPVTVRLPGPAAMPNREIVESDTWTGPADLAWALEPATGATATGVQRPVGNGNGGNGGNGSNVTPVEAKPRSSSLLDEHVALERQRAQVERERLTNEANLKAAQLQAALDDANRKARNAEDEAARKVKATEDEAARKFKLLEEETTSRLSRMESSFEAKLALLRVDAQAPAVAKESNLEKMVFDLLASQAAAAEARSVEAIRSLEARAAADRIRDQEHAAALSAMQQKILDTTAKSNPQLEMLDNMMASFGKVMQHSLNMMQVSADMRGVTGAPEAGGKNPTSELIDTLANAGDKLLGRWFEGLKLRGVQQMAPGLTGASGDQLAAGLQGQRQLPPGPTGAPAPSRAPAPAPLTPLNPKPGLPDVHVMRIIKLIAIYTPPEQLGVALAEELNNSRAVGDDFHRRASDFGVIFAEAAPHLAQWFDADPAKAKAYLENLQAAFAGANAAEAAKETGNGGAAGPAVPAAPSVPSNVVPLAPVAPTVTASPERNPDFVTPSADERNPVAPE